MRGKTVKAVQWVVVVGIVLGLVVSLAACSPEDSGAGDVVGQGYVSGDGSVQTYDVGERKGPVAITGTDFEGDDVDTAGWAGDVVVVNTWYASCAPCRAEAPDLVSLAGSKDGVQFLGINTEDDAGAAQAFQRTFEVPYPSIEDRTGKVIAGLSGVVPLQAVPSTVVLDQEGNVAARVIGQVEGSTLEALIDEVLAEAA
ncbi:TlpA disulfide reductase family protein [Promicromonospora sp. MEB111]|uniref:TlpA family protein disulfide reductase n=1 Tax=unclassified Promicromonospora TaxID=2647929 RepID=UPI00254BCDDF|nr:TlpA disulfide reductase family protein [Promicromonospora sp. MEB111]